jgi:four helix bundle protein
LGDFRKLRVWQEAKDLAIRIYNLTNKNGFQRDFSLKDQLRRSAISISSNIAEGDELGTNKQAINHFYHARGSAAELLSQLTISQEIGLLNEKEYEELEDTCKKIGAMLNQLIKARK